jgi:hypothetical protein
MRYTEIIETKKTPLVAELAFGFIILSSLFFTLNTKVNAYVKDVLDRNPSATFQYPQYTNSNQEKITIKEKINVEKIFFNGVESRDTVTVTLSEGTNKFEFVLTGNGKEIIREIEIIKDTITPEITSNFSFQDKKTNQRELSITGSLNEEGAVKINGNICDMDKEDFTCQLNVKGEGKTTVQILAEDKAGNQVEKIFTITLDKEAPFLEIKYPEKTFQSSAKIVISSKENLEKVTVGGLEARKEGEESFSKEVNLKLGNNHFDIEATDEAGNKTKESITIKRNEIASGGGSSGGSYNPPDNDSGNGNTNSPPSTGCTSISLDLYNVKTPVFSGETQTANVKLTCSDGSGYGGQSVTVTVRYADGATRSYSGTTNSSGIASFSFTVEDRAGSASLTAKYGLAQTSVSFNVN